MNTVMKSIIRTLVIAIALIGASLASPILSLISTPRPASAQAEVNQGSISITGEAQILVVPDEVIISLGVQTVNKDLTIAKTENDERVKRVLALTKEFGIQPEHVQTDFISIEPRYRDTYAESEFYGFFVRKSIVVKLKDISKFEDFISRALTSGANYLHGINFRTTELRKYRDQARSLAINAAKEKATALAGELGRTLGKPTSIREDQIGWYSSYGGWWGSRYNVQSQNVVQSAGGGGGAVAGAEEGTIALGQITVSARVYVAFELVAAAK
jgi:uncharacterized protein YggE